MKNLPFIPSSNRFFKNLSLLAMVLMLGINGVMGQISIPSATPVTENFTIGTSATASLPTDWKMSAAGAGSSSLSYSAAGNLTATTVAASSGSPNSGGRYNWGNGTTNTDRAIGFMASGSYATPNSIMAFYRNTSGVQINDITIAFDFERYRINSATVSVSFYTSTNGTSWTARTSGDIATSVFATGSNSYNFTSGTVASRSVSLTGVNIANNGNFYVMWLITNTGGSNSQGIGLDNVSLTATLSITAPVVTSSAASSITTTGATLNGNVTSDGGSAVTDRGFVYKTSAGVTINDNKTTVSGTTGTFTLTPTLSVNTQYFFNAYAINSINTTLSTPELSFYTLANVPSAPTVNNPTTSSLDVTINANSNPSATEFAIQETGGNYVQANGTLGVSAVWQTAATWGTRTVSGLSPSTSYTFQVKARNGSNVETAFGSTANNTTSTPVSPTISASASVGGAVSNTYGTASSATTFSASGASLTNDIIITPPTGFEVSTTAGSGYTTSLTLTQSGGIVNSTTIYLRLMATAGVSGTYNNQNIVLTSTGATPVNVTTAASGNTVTAKALTITGLTGVGRVYDATTTATVSGTAAYSGLENGESFSVSGTPVFTFASKTIGVSKAITVTGYTAPNGNYSVSQPAGLTATITAASLTITSPTATNRAYNPTTNVTVGGSLSGVLLTDVVTLSTTGTIATAAVGSGKIVTFSISGADEGNYTLTQPGTTVDISKADQTITFGALSNVTTATANYSPGATASSGLPVTYTSSNTSVATIVTNQIDPQGAGTTNITASQAGDGNYNAASDVIQVLTVTLAPETILAFDFAGAAGDQTSSNSTTNVSNIATSTVTRGNGLQSAANADGFRAQNWSITDIAAAVTNDDYIQFSVTPNSGFQFTVSSIILNIQRSAAGLRGIALRSSVDNYATNLDTEKSISDLTNTTQTVTFTFSQSNSSSAITYRLYGYAEDAGGTGGFEGTGNDIIVTGTTSQSPTATISNTSFAQFGAQDIVRNTVNNPVSRFRVDVTNGATTLSTVSFTTPANASTNNYGGNDGTGVYTSDIDNFKLYYTTTSTFATSNLLGTSNSVNFRPTPGETVSFTSLALNLPIGTYYFWITTDVLSSATSDRKMTVNAPTLTLSVGTVSGSTTASGEQTIIGVPITYYLNGTNNISTATSYWTGANGTGTQLGSLSTTDLYLNIGSSVSTTGDFTLSNGSKFIVNNGGNLTLASGHTITGTIDVENGGTLTLNSTSIPTLGTLGGTSTIVYGASGAQAVTTKDYANLTISGGNTKTISGAAAVSGTLTINGTVLALDNNSLAPNTLTLGGLGTKNGSWGSTAGSATYKNATYFGSTGTGTVTPSSNTAATPTISAVTASQSITYGTANITLTGNIASGSIYPATTETTTMTVSINGDSQNTTIAANGAFSITYTSNTIPYSATPYTITYAYAGNGFLNAASNETSTALTVNAATNNWTGGTGNWSALENWSLSRIPSSLNDNITISSGSPTMDVSYTVGAERTLTISGTGALIISPTSTLTVAGTADFGGKLVTFKSDETGTAMFGVFTGTLTNATNVKVERYIPLGKRAFRFLSPAVTTTNFISNNWQQQTHITGGLGTTGLGFDATATNNPSMYTYNNQVVSGTGWTAIANTNATNLTAGVGYRVLIRGDRTASNITAASAVDMNAAITLSATGTLKTGEVALNASSTPSINNTGNITTAGYSLVGNPYQSAVNWNAVTKSGIDATYYAWDPNMGTTAQRGRYVAFNGTDNDNNLSQVGQFIQPGQAFFVKNTVSGAPGTLTFLEAHKATTNANVFRTANQTESANLATLSTVLYDPNELAIGGYPIDAMKALFSTDYANELGLGDATKLESAGENIAWFRNNAKLAIDAATPVTTSDELVMKTLRLGANKNYTFKIQTTNFDTALTPYLVDTFLNTQTEISTSQAFLAPFATTTNVASYSENRFKIVFQNALLNTDTFTTQVGLYPNPSKGNGFYLQLPSTTKATVKLYNTIGQEIAITNNDGHYQANQSLATGVYYIIVTQDEKTSKLKWIVE